MFFNCRRSIHSKQDSFHELVRCRIADGIPDEHLHSLESDDGIFTDSSPVDSNSSSRSESSTLASSGTIVASEVEEHMDEDMEEGYEGYDWGMGSPGLEEAGEYRSGSDTEDFLEDDGVKKRTYAWREAICFRQYRR